MRGFEMNALIIILFISITKATETSVEDDDAVIELEEYTEHQTKEESLKNSINNDDKRDKKILSPYPIPASPFDENGGQGKNDKGPNEKFIRKSRFLLWSYPQSPIVDMVMQQTISHNYMPHNGNDPFDFLRDTYPLPKGYTAPLEEYDYVIVGAGSAGSVLASRLTEDKPRAMVLLIEAGKPEMLFTEIPILAHYMQLTDMSWHYSTEKQPGVCLGSDEQKCWWRRGKAVGGTSVTNYMLYTRGRPQDWERIAADGNYGWSYSDVLKYYIKSEKCELEKYRNRPYRGRDGELTVEQPSVRTGLVEAYLAAGRINGIPTVDYNNPDELGFGYTQATTDRGHRMSAAKAFLHKHKRRRNLHILTETRATQVLIEPQTKRAYAVDYVRNGKKYRVRARREVILSAGPIASPQLLMLSGVGPQEHLQSLGIPVIQNLPVGKTLYDHLGFPGVIFRLNTTNASLMESKIATIPNVIQWLHYGDGLLSIPGGIEGLGYIKTSVSDDPEPVPDMEVISFGSSVAVDSGNLFARSMGLSRALYDYTYSALNGKDTWSVVLMQLHPKSKGYLELRDTNPFSYPKLYGNYLTDPADMATFKESIQFAIRMGQSESFRKYGPQLHLGTFQSCPSAELGSDEYWDCAVRTVAVSLQHQIATCRMGPPGDPDAVVDPELRVYGIDGLRVVDSSVIPRTIGAHTNAPAIMIGEKGADMIKMAWANVKSKY